MAEIRVNVTASKSQRVNVSSSNIATEITATPDTSQYYSNLAKNWAIAENIVDGKDYSSKHYAKEAQQASELANTYKQATEQAYISFSEQASNAEIELTSIKDASVQEINTAVTDGKTEINNTKDLAIDAVNNTKTTILQDIEFVADGEKEEIRDLANDIKEGAEDIINRVGLNMFDTVVKDHVLTYEESRGLALQGTYVYKDAIAGSRYGYPDFYNKVLEEYNQATTTETVNGVTVKVHSNGHKFYDIANKTSIDEFFNSMGSAWFYGVDTTNECIFLPRNNFFEQATDDSSEVGLSVEAGLPNITATFMDGGNKGANMSGAVTANSATTIGHDGGADTTYRSYVANFNASRSNSIYGKSDTVQPNAVKKLLYICVGNTVSNTSWVDVVTQVEGGVKDLEDKKNACLDEIATLGDSYDNLTHRNITNCLLEVPQRIKLELADGVLTLKAGSEVIIPNGFEADGTTLKFDYVTVDSDLSWPASTTEGTRLAFKSGNYIVGYVSTYCYSGNTAKMNSTSAVTYGRFYNTETNKMYRGDGTNWIETVDSLPVCLFTNDSTATVTSIDQIFNGMGYIGSTIWVDKGVKGLIPNGRNEDGSLNSIEVVTNRLRLQTNPFGAADSGSATFHIIISNTSIALGVAFRYIESVSEPTTTYTTWYNPNTNLIKYTGATAKAWESRTMTPVFYAHYNFDSSTKVNTFTSLIPKQPFRAVDYNDKAEIVSWGMPDYNKATSITISSSNVVVPYRGVLLYPYALTNSAPDIYINNIRVGSFGGTNTSGGAIYFPVEAGDLVRTSVTYNFQFVIAPFKGGK